MLRLTESGRNKLRNKGGIKLTPEQAVGLREGLDELAKREPFLVEVQLVGVDDGGLLLVGEERVIAVETNGDIAVDDYPEPA